MNQTAYLSNRGEYTTFSVGDRTITFLTSKNLEKYIEVVEWDQGYLVVISKNKGKLLIDPVSFLDPIKEVKIRYA